jgi:copper chaperone
MISTTYHVTGMTCEHCTRAVSAELGALDGVAGVMVDLVPGGASAVTVESSAPLGDGAVAAALDEAGDYRLALPGAARLLP